MMQSYSLLHLTLTHACNGHWDQQLPQSGLKNYCGRKTVQKRMTEKAELADGSTSHQHSNQLTFLQTYVDVQKQVYLGCQTAGIRFIKYTVLPGP